MAVETVYSANLKDPWVHHPEPKCHDRLEIIKNGNDETGSVATPGQYLTADDGDGGWRFLRRCYNCLAIENARYGLTN